MGVHHQSQSKKHPRSSSTCFLHLKADKPATSKSDLIWNNPKELDLLDLRKAPMIEENHYFNVLPAIRRLYRTLNCRCPNLYRIHCSDSQRVLLEILFIIEEYLRVKLPSKLNETILLEDENHLDKFIDRIQFTPYSTIFSNQRPRINQIDIRCFGRGIRAWDSNNQLNRTTLFCFELTMPVRSMISGPIEIIIVDPNNRTVSNDVRCINTYDQGYTKLYSCSYTPTTTEGNYQISFLYNKTQLTKYPYSVYIQDPTKKVEALENYQKFLAEREEKPNYTLEGDGYSTKVIVDSIARFRLRLTSTNNSFSQLRIIDAFTISILDPFGHRIVVQRRLLSPDLLELTYQPMSIGSHQLQILYKDRLDRQLTIEVVSEETNSSIVVKTFGPALREYIVGLPTEFYVFMASSVEKTNTQDHLQFSLKHSFHAEIDYERRLATVRFTPDEEGRFPIRIIEENDDITDSPFMTISRKIKSFSFVPNVRVHGLPKNIVIHHTVEFQVIVENPIPELSNALRIEILTEEKSPEVKISHNHNYTIYQCSFTPEHLQQHIISIDYAGVVAESNPFFCDVILEKDIQLMGPAMNSQCLSLNQPTHFFFKLKDFLATETQDKFLTYESGYSSNEDISMGDKNKKQTEHNNDYQVTITDSQGHVKSNVLVQELANTVDDAVRVDFTPDEKVLFINISCTW